MIVEGIRVKTIPGFHNYAISRDGEVWSKPRVRSSGFSWPGGWLKKRIHQRGYEEVHLRKDNKHFYRLTHRLILLTYVSPPPPNKVTLHLNSAPLDNRMENLKWGTQKENIQETVRRGTHDGFNRRGEKHPLAKLTERNVRMIVYLYRTGLFLQREIAEIYNITAGGISRIIQRRNWEHIWKIFEKKGLTNL